MTTGYISRRAVLNLLKEMSVAKAEEGTWEDGWETAVDYIRNAVIKLPAVRSESADKSGTAQKILEMLTEV